MRLVVFGLVLLGVSAALAAVAVTLATRAAIRWFRSVRRRISRLWLGLVAALPAASFGGRALTLRARVQAAARGASGAARVVDGRPLADDVQALAEEVDETALRLSHQLSAASRTAARGRAGESELLDALEQQVEELEAASRAVAALGAAVVRSTPPWYGPPVRAEEIRRRATALHAALDELAPQLAAGPQPAPERLEPHTATPALPEAG